MIFNVCSSVEHHSSYFIMIKWYDFSIYVLFYELYYGRVFLSNGNGSIITVIYYKIYEQKVNSEQ